MISKVGAKISNLNVRLWSTGAGGGGGAVCLTSAARGKYVKLGIGC